MCGPDAAHGLGGVWHGRFVPEQLAPDLVLLRADSSRWPSPGNVLVVLDEEGAALVDCGFGTTDCLTALDTALRSLGSALSAVHTVLCTHPHSDHAGAAVLLAQACLVLVPAGAPDVLRDPAIGGAAILPDEVRELAPWLAGIDVEGHFREDCGVSALPAGLAVEEVYPGDTVRLGRYTWTAVATTGHDAHMMCYWEESAGIIVYSDLLVTAGTAIPWYAPGGGGTQAYLDGLRQIGGMQAQLGVSGHGGLLAGQDAVAEAVAKTAGRISTRSARIATAMAAGPVPFAELERCVYPTAVHDVIPWASSVAAVHVLEAVESGAAMPVEGGFVTTGAFA